MAGISSNGEQPAANTQKKIWLIGIIGSDKTSKWQPRGLKEVWIKGVGAKGVEEEWEWVGVGGGKMRSRRSG